MKQKKNVPQFGLFRGRIWMSSDFDQPLEEFAEYLPKRRLKRRARRKR